MSGEQKQKVAETFADYVEGLKRLGVTVSRSIRLIDPVRVELMKRKGKEVDISDEFGLEEVPLEDMFELAEHQMDYAESVYRRSCLEGFIEKEHKKNGNHIIKPEHNFDPYLEYLNFMRKRWGSWDEDLFFMSGCVENYVFSLIAGAAIFTRSHDFTKLKEHRDMTVDLGKTAELSIEILSEDPEYLDPHNELKLCAAQVSYLNAKLRYALSDEQGTKKHLMEAYNKMGVALDEVFMLDPVTSSFYNQAHMYLAEELLEQQRYGEVMSLIGSLDRSYAPSGLYHFRTLGIHCFKKDPEAIEHLRDDLASVYPKVQSDFDKEAIQRLMPICDNKLEELQE